MYITHFFFFSFARFFYFTFLSYPLRYRARLDSVVTVIDADQFLEWVGRDPAAPKQLPSAAALSQIKHADVILLNKTDLLTEDEAHVATSLVKQFNADAVIHNTVGSKVPLEAILDVSLAHHEFGPDTGANEVRGHEGTVSSVRHSDES